MSYKISYGEFEISERKSRAKQWRIVVVAALFVLGVTARLCFPEQMKRLTQTLFPLTTSASQEALTAFSENLKAGEPLSDSVAAFCLEILHGAGVQ